MVNYGCDLLVMGGYHRSFSSAIYRFFSENGMLQWEKMEPELTIPIAKWGWFEKTALMIPDDLVDA